ncbi:MAG: indole-3-glycerol phosphate synthase TrpC [Eubacterium sp.]|nr:indole-3-glycerol phosphate synthase TrpC [Eubacterium sp.]
MILDDIVAATKIRLEKAEQAVSFDEIKQAALSLPVSEDFPFKKALAKDGLSFICEVKKASPSKGVIAEDFPYLEIAERYRDMGADAISVLTEPDFFKGSPDYLREIAANVNIPCLRKDFIIGEYQIYEAKTLGAKAILLICAILDDEQLKSYLTLAHSLGMSALVETHNEDEVTRALNSGAEIIGINNRDLRTFNVELSTTAKLAQLIPDDKIIVSESGIHTPDDIAFVRNAGADAVLIGEAFMRADDKAGLLNRFKGK